MLKRYISVALVFLLLLCSTGCRPSGLSDSYYNIGLKALEIADRYISFDITADEAYEAINALPLSSLEKPDSNTSADGNVHLRIFILESDLLLASSEAKTYEEVLDSRNALAKAIGKSSK